MPATVIDMRERVTRPDEVDVKPRERPQPPSPEYLLRLQATAGNAAVTRLLQRRATLARTKFKDAAGAREWIAAAGEDKERPEGYSDEDWHTELLLSDPAGYGSPGDLYFNLQMLEQPTVVATPTRQPPKGKKLRDVPSGIWEHIVNGTKTSETTGKGKVESVTGLHTTKGPNPQGRGVGSKTPFGTYGCYEQTVEPINLSPGAKAAEKKNKSSFYPDDWELEDIKEAIEYASGKGASLEVLTPAKGASMRLRFNNASYYPTDR